VLGVRSLFGSSNQAFYEYFPFESGKNVPNFSATVRGFDQIEVVVWYCNSSGSAALPVTNTCIMMYNDYNGDVYYPNGTGVLETINGALGQSAEAIVERPSICEPNCSQSEDLDHFSEVEFYNPTVQDNIAGPQIMFEYYGGDGVLSGMTSLSNPNAFDDSVSTSYVPYGNSTLLVTWTNYK
jgi:hypothetical protein